MESEKISAEDQREYWSGVGMLFFLDKHSRPDIANMIRELSKATVGMSPVTFKELLHVIKYILDKKNFSLKLKPTENANKPWDIVCFRDSDYGGDPMGGRSISGSILYVPGEPISWWSKAQKSGILSSSEAAWEALSEAIKEVMFVIQLLRCMKISVQLQAMAWVNNVDTIFIASNITTKYVNIRYKYVNVYVKDGCKGGNDCDSISEKHEDFSSASSHGKSRQFWHHIYCK